MHHHLQASAYLASAAIFAATLFGFAETPRSNTSNIHSNAPSKPDTAAVRPDSAPYVQPAAADTKPDAECPEYAAVLADRSGKRLLVVVTFKACPACEAMKTDLTNHGVPFVEVNRERHPGTFNSFHASKYPTWYIIRNGETVANGARQMRFDFFKQILEEPQ